MHDNGGLLASPSTDEQRTKELLEAKWMGRFCLVLIFVAHTLAAFVAGMMYAQS